MPPSHGCGRTGRRCCGWADQRRLPFGRPSATASHVSRPLALPKSALPCDGRTGDALRLITDLINASIGRPGRVSTIRAREVLGAEMSGSRIASRVWQKASGGAKLISSTKRISDKKFAANAIAYSTPDHVNHYLSIAKGGKRRDFEDYGSNKTTYIGVPNGGIVKPQDVGLWGGSVYRIAFAKKGTPEKEVVEKAVSSGWWFSYETAAYFRHKAKTPAELLELVRAELALGFKLEDETTRILSVQIAAPTASYMGSGNPTSANYEIVDFPIYYGNPHLPQYYIPGLQDLNGTASKDVIDKVFDQRTSNLQNAIEFLNRPGFYMTENVSVESTEPDGDE